MYDHFGIPIVNTFDQHGSFGLSTDLGNPAGVVTVRILHALPAWSREIRLVSAGPACRRLAPF